MANYVLAYRGGGVPEGDDAQKAAMAAWMEWFGELAEKVIDGGAPFGPSASVGASGVTSDGAPSALTGYSILAADSLEAACKLAAGCPALSSGGSVDVYEPIQM